MPLDGDEAGRDRIMAEVKDGKRFGAAAIELNIYYLPGDPHVTRTAELVPRAEVKLHTEDVQRTVRRASRPNPAIARSPFFGFALPW